jgi:hypothetical protein
LLSAGFFSQPEAEVRIANTANERLNVNVLRMIHFLSCKEQSQTSPVEMGKIPARAAA